MNGCDCACHHGHGDAHVSQTCRCKPDGEGYRTVADAEQVRLAALVATEFRRATDGASFRRKPARRR